MSPKTVAMVEDDPMILRINRLFLKETPQYRLIWEATTVAKAWELLQAQSPDLLLLDIYLPDKSGLSLLELLKQKENPPQVIMITAADEAESIMRALEKGVQDYLIKPYLKERFIQALNDVYLNLTPQDKFTQADVDLLLAKRQKQLQFSSLPKGLNFETLIVLLNLVKAAPAGITADDLAKGIGLAVVSVRRYLHYLIEAGKVSYKPVYGQQGRPAHRYFFVNSPQHE